MDKPGPAPVVYYEPEPVMQPPPVVQLPVIQQPMYDAPPSAPTECIEVVRRGNLIVYRMVFPEGNPTNGVILVEKALPDEVNVGVPFDFTITVKNIGDCPLEEVTVADTVSDSFEISSSVPPAGRDALGRVIWSLGTLAAGETREIKVTGMAKAAGQHVQCTTAEYRRKLCATVTAFEPKLGLSRQAPAEVLVCDPIPVVLTVSNTGIGTVRNVTVSERLPDGLTTDDGSRTVNFDVTALDTGDSRELTYTAKATKPGRYEGQAVARAGALSANAASATVVKKPVLTITKTGTDKQYTGRMLTYQITVANQGDGVAKNTVLWDTIPPTTTFVKATEGGRASNQNVIWDLGELAPGGNKSVRLTLRADEISNVTNTAQVEAVCAEAVSATTRTVVAGIPAILLEVVDLEDPIEVGGLVNYVITATNQGSLPGTNVQITCALEPSQSYVSCSGTTDATVKGNVVTFAPVKAIAPKQQATWRLVVKAMKTGDVRFRVSMNSDQLTRPVDESEATNQY